MRTLTFVVAMLVAGNAAAQPKKDPPKPAVTRSVTGTVKVLEADGKEVQNVQVVAYVVGPSIPEQPGKEVVTATITQTQERTFSPDLVSITTGEKVAFPNGGKLLHNVFSAKPKFDLGSFNKGESKDSKDAFKNYKGTAEIYCNIHPEMAATVLVLPNPYHKSFNTKAGKTFTISNLPPGKHKLYVYTRRAEKPVAVDIDVTEKDATVAEIKITRGAETKHLNKYGEKYKDGRSYP